METLKNKTCVPCKAGAPKLNDSEIKELSKKIEGWSIEVMDGEKRLEKEFTFENYRESLEFVKKVGELAEENNHHPVMLFEFRQVTVWWWTHKIGGLHENDFIMASKTDTI